MVKGSKHTKESLRKISISQSNRNIVAWNKGTKGIMKANKTSFSKGHTPPHKGEKLRPEAIENIRKSTSSK